MALGADALDDHLLAPERRVDALFPLAHDLAQADAARFHRARVHVERFLNHRHYQGLVAWLAACALPTPELSEIEGQLVAAVLLPSRASSGTNTGAPPSIWTSTWARLPSNGHVVVSMVPRRPPGPVTVMIPAGVMTAPCAPGTVGYQVSARMIATRIIKSTTASQWS
jgi:hypothetical protein